MKKGKKTPLRRMALKNSPSPLEFLKEMRAGFVFIYDKIVLVQVTDYQSYLLCARFYRTFEQPFEKSYNPKQLDKCYLI